jgi:hypothetical protein
MNIRELFGVDYLLPKKDEKTVPATNKLSDMVVWEPEALRLTDVVMGRIREKIYEMAKKRCYDNDRLKIHKGDIFGILQELNLYYYDSED